MFTEREGREPEVRVSVEGSSCHCFIAGLRPTGVIVREVDNARKWAVLWYADMPVFVWGSSRPPERC